MRATLTLRHDLPRRFLELETHRQGITVFVRPEVVAEIALDGVQVSTRYPGGVSLRFARLKRYRDDKPPAEADTLESLRGLLPFSDAESEEAPGATAAPGGAS